MLPWQLLPCFVAGGAGGKGVWGKPGAELQDAEIDSGDPNYDSEAMDDDIQLEQVTVELTEEEVKVQQHWAVIGMLKLIFPINAMFIIHLFRYI